MRPVETAGHQSQQAVLHGELAYDVPAWCVNCLENCLLPIPIRRAQGRASPQEDFTGSLNRHGLGHVTDLSFTAAARQDDIAQHSL